MDNEGAARITVGVSDAVVGVRSSSAPLSLLFSSVQGRRIKVRL